MSAPSTQATSTLISPNIRFFSGRSEFFVQDGNRWRRMNAEDEAHLHTGVNRETREPSVGICIVPRGNGMLRIGFDLWKINANLSASVIERLKNRWQQREAVNLSPSLLRSVSPRVHISKSFARFEISIHRVEEWQSELLAILSNPQSYESL